MDEDATTACCIDAEPDDGYVCEKCGGGVIFCSDCHTILDPCPCGHCPEGATFHESE